ncbi:MAG: Sec-independent protein translocase subunit TatA [Moraxellaceae bacterium]|jgi:sec-independent protein translocase protein TatA|nr:Sec-independent protein translocase subunit TatA [Moraxellaceae bacterium]MDF3030466.1 Sec-independent protein translocase subunit TatA [Moraxellaceae bacterium]
MLSGLSLPHIILLLVVVVLIFGTSKLKNAGRDLGGFFKGFKEGMKSDEEKPQPPQQLTQEQNGNAAQQTSEKKDNV